MGSLKTLIIIFILFSCEVKEDISTPEAYAQTFVKSIREKDLVSFKELIISKDDLISLLPENELSENRKKFEEWAAFQANTVFERSREIFNNLNYNSITYIGCKYNIQKDENEYEVIKNFKIYIKGNGLNETILLDHLIKTKNGWKSIGWFSVGIDL